jgi:hypothetical protein
MRSIRKDDIILLLRLTELKKARRAFAQSLIECTDIELKEIRRELGEIKSNTVRKQVIVARSFGLTDSDELESKLNHMTFLVEKYQVNRLNDDNKKRNTANELLLDFLTILEDEERTIYDKELQ